MFAPGAADMSDAALRIVLRHELFHYAARAETAADAPRWLTEGVADFVGRPPRLPRRHGSPQRLPTDAELRRPGNRSQAYDRAWWFSRFVADTTAPPTLRALYLRRVRTTATPTSATAVHDTLGADLDDGAAGGGSGCTASLTGDEPGPAGYQRLSAAPRRHPVLPAGTGRPVWSMTGTHTLTVYAPKWKGAEEFDARRAGYEVVRHPGTLMLPEPSVASRMRRLIERHDVDTVWFGAAAPLALMAPLARDAGAGRVIASTHGHEVGWSMLPLARTALRRIGDRHRRR